MEIVLTIIAVVLLVVGAIAGRKSNISTFNESRGVLSETITPTPTAVATPRNSISIKTREPASTLSPVITGSSTLGDLTYPPAKIVAEGSNYLKLETPDSPDKVTSFYKSKIESLKPKSKAYTETSTNGQVLNKLAFSQNGQQITIEIKSGSSSGTEINLSRD